jgi:hypothetical protein
VAAGQGTRNGNAANRPGFQERDAVTDASFAVTTDAGGDAVFAIRGGDFALDKVVSPSGDATLRLTQGKDIVTIAMSQSGFQVGRGRRTVHIDPRADTGEGFDAARALLLGSSSVRSFKRLAAALENRNEAVEDGPLSIVALIDGAIVQLLDGDADAPKRIAQRITRRQRAAFRPAAVKRAPDTFRDCIGVYQVSLVVAYNQYQSCWIESIDASWWTRSYILKLCEWEWALSSQQYIWQFVGCIMLPI